MNRSYETSQRVQLYARSDIQRVAIVELMFQSALGVKQKHKNRVMRPYIGYALSRIYMGQFLTSNGDVSLVVTYIERLR